MNDATNGSLGSATSSAGVPVWRSSPSTITPTLVGERRGVLEVVRDEQHRHVEAGEQLCSSARTAAFVWASSADERLVEEQHLRVAGERARERDALALAAGEVVRAARRARCAIPKRSR